MGLFKDVYCAECGEKTKMLTRTCLCDDNYLCSKCASIVPDYIHSTFESKYTLEDYKELKKELDESEEYGKVFHQTHSFYNLHMDAERGLFYVDDILAKKTLYLSLCSVDRFNLTFQPEEYKEGFLGEKIKGSIYMELEVEDPYFYYTGVLASGVKVKAKKGLFGKKISYEDPEGMDSFLYAFNCAWERDLDGLSQYAEEHAEELEEKRLEQED